MNDILSILQMRKDEALDYIGCLAKEPLAEIRKQLFRFIMTVYPDGYSGIPDKLLSLLMMILMEESRRFENDLKEWDPNDG